MDFMAQLQAHLMSHQYEGLLKKANLKSLGGKSDSGTAGKLPGRRSDTKSLSGPSSSR